MYCTIKALPVRCGDCMLVSFNQFNSLKAYYLLIDTGYANTYHRTLKPVIRTLVEQGQKIDLLILTHTDSDHIGGVRPLLADFGLDWFSDVWFNYAPIPFTVGNDLGAISIRQGISLRDHLIQANKVNIHPIVAGHKQSIGKALITVLTPNIEQFKTIQDEWRNEESLKKAEAPIANTKSDHDLLITSLINKAYVPDSSLSNRSSIAFELQIGSAKALFTGDAHADLLIKSLQNLGYTPNKPIRLQLMKVGHHGSRGNTSNELMSYIDCNHYLISTNTANHHQFPHKEALARIIWANHARRPTEPIHLYFTYGGITLMDLFTHEENQEFNIVCHYPNNETDGITVTFTTNE